jgi:hypothetical protein
MRSSLASKHFVAGEGLALEAFGMGRTPTLAF